MWIVRNENILDDAGFISDKVFCKFFSVIQKIVSKIVK